MTRILFVDAFSATAKSRTAFKRSRACVVKCLKTLGNRSVNLIDYDLKFVHISKMQRYTLGDPRLQEQVLKEIDKLDIIILDGDSGTMPWSPILDPLTTFIRVCVMARKCLFAAGRMANALSFVLADGTSGKPFSIVNGGGVGTSLSLLGHFNAKDFEGSRENFAFLDCDTGDLYFPRYGTWTRAGSVGNSTGTLAPTASPDTSPKGLHARSARPSSAAPRHQNPPANKHLLRAFAGRNDEAVGRVRTECSSHFLFHGMNPSEAFVVQRLNGVNVADARLIRNCTYRFRTLAVEQAGGGSSGDRPVLFTYHNAVGATFRLTEKYAVSGVILQNFLVEKLSRILEEGHIDQRLHATSVGDSAAASAAHAAALRKEASSSADGQSGTGSGPATTSSDDEEHSLPRAPPILDHHGRPTLQAKTKGRPGASKPRAKSAGVHRSNNGSLSARAPVIARKTWTQTSTNVKRAVRPYSARIERNSRELRQRTEDFEETTMMTKRRDSPHFRNLNASVNSRGSRQSGADGDTVDDRTVNLAALPMADLLGRQPTNKFQASDGSTDMLTSRTGHTINSRGQRVIRKKVQKRPPSKSYLKWRQIEKARGNEQFFSVVQGSKYESDFDQQIRLAKEGKEKWVVPEPFKTYSGKRSAMGQGEAHMSINVGTTYYPPGTHEFRPHKTDKNKLAGKRDWRFV